VTASSAPPCVGILANPMSGRDVRRLAARASMTTVEIKRDQVARAAVGAVAAGARRIVVVRDPLRIGCGALEHLELAAERLVLDVGAELRASDSERAARALREAGCTVLVVLGGDGTNRAVARAWPEVTLVPLSTGTNNVFPLSVEATAAGAAAGLVAAGRVPRDEVARAQKCVRVEIEGEPDDLALIDAVRLVDDSVGNLMPVDAARIREVLLARAEPTAVGVSSLGGLTLPCGPADDFGVALRCGPHAAGGRPLLAPLAPGLFRTVHVEEVRRVELGERVHVTGPGVLAFDGDRERTLAPGQRAVLTLRRDGPRVIDVARALALSAQAHAFFDRGHWHDPFDHGLGGGGVDCC
jgi:hypothetical protein